MLICIRTSNAYDYAVYVFQVMQIHFQIQKRDTEQFITMSNIILKQEYLKKFFFNETQSIDKKRNRV